MQEQTGLNGLTLLFQLPVYVVQTVASWDTSKVFDIGAMHGTGILNTVLVEIGCTPGKYSDGGLDRFNEQRSYDARKRASEETKDS